MASVKEQYTRKVSGDAYDYELEYGEGVELVWQARVYCNGLLKGSPRGSLTDNTLQGMDLQQYLVSYVEGMIERGLDIAE